jgi:2-polyprenyl-3-methyl-5-hydroxy-6-metoxy-1,4-benzoquinol methylase
VDKNKIAVDIFNKLASQYQEKYMNVDAYTDTLDFFCDVIKKQDPEILELACGPGNITRYLLHKRPGLKILGTDLAPNMVALARQNNPAATFKILDCREIASLRKQFDGIMCGFCLPYLPKEEAIQLIEDAANILKPGGIFYLSTMEDDYNKSGPKKGSNGDELYMYYHEAAYLTAALEKNKFKVLLTKRQPYPDENPDTDLILIAEANPNIRSSL